MLTMTTPKQTRGLAKIKRLKKNTSVPEQRLWRYIRRGQLVPFVILRQRAFHPYYVDFYIPQYKLVIEVDGPHHEETKEYDDTRTKYLESKGLTVLRVSSDDVMNRIESVLEKIRNNLPLQ